MGILLCIWFRSNQRRDALYDRNRNMDKKCDGVIEVRKTYHYICLTESYMPYVLLITCHDIDDWHWYDKITWYCKCEGNLICVIYVPQCAPCCFCLVWRYWYLIWYLSVPWYKNMCIICVIINHLQAYDMWKNQWYLTWSIMHET